MRDYLNIFLIFSILTSITYLSTATVSTGSTNLPISYIGHFLMYFSLASALLVYFHEKEHTHLDAVIIAGVIGLVFELVQTQIPFRTYSDTDVIVNFVGAGTVLIEQRIPVVHKVVEYEDKFIESVW